jgi:hypothetical protein
VAKVEWHPGELYPRVGSIVTNLARPAERVVAFYNHRGTCEQYIKEGKGAVKWTRLSCRSFAANAVRCCGVEGDDWAGLAPAGSRQLRLAHHDLLCAGFAGGSFACPLAIKGLQLP